MNNASPRPVNTRRIRCQVVETSADPDSRVARDLLPWADPYIASLMESLEREATACEPPAAQPTAIRLPR